MPYFSLDGSPGADVELRIDGPTTFVLRHGFRYVDPDNHDRAWCVKDGLRTDLASVPFFLQWLVRSYGKHTRAALIHDQHWDDADTSEVLHDLNHVFRDAMREDGVPLVRRWLVWSAVSIAGLAKIGLGGWVRLILWVVGLTTVIGAALGGADVQVAWPIAWITAGSLGVIAVVFAIVGITGGSKSARRKLCLQVVGITVGYGALILVITALSSWRAVQDHAVLVAGAAAAVALFAAIPDWRASAIATVMAWLVLVPTTAVFAALAVYGLLESIFYCLRYPVRLAKNEPKPAPLVTSYIGRPPDPL